MERNVSLKYTVMILLMTAVLCLSGCGRSEDPGNRYRFEDRMANFKEDASVSFIPGFADEICVVSGDTESETILTADAAAVLDLNGGSSVYEYNALERMNPASTTKVMTAIIALKYGNLDDLVTVTEDAIITETGSSMAGVAPGDQITLKDLLYGLMIPSGNDAANAIAVHVGGSIDSFVSMMNEEAARIGATGTHFVNANGLTDPEHYTTAYDLFLMFREALKFDTFRTIIGTHTYTSVFADGDGNEKTATWGVGNYYMNGKTDTPEGLTVFGGKTGTTNAAGYCLIMGSRTEDGREYASVIMKADSRNDLYTDMTNIINKIDK